LGAEALVGVTAAGELDGDAVAHDRRREMMRFVGRVGQKAERAERT
jgi:hypothetical protein